MTSPDDSERERSEALCALEQGAAEVGLDLPEPDLIRIGSNAVFRSGTTIVRVSAPHADIESVRTTVEVARWLAGHSVPVTEVLDVRQPITAGDRVVTFWRSVSDRTVFGTTEDCGRLLAKMHAIQDPAPVPLPGFDPGGKAARRLSKLQHLDAGTRDFLADRLGQLAADFGGLTFALRPGPIHGDANVGNVLVDDAGVARLADLDSFATGAREWDLIQTAQYYEQFGWHTRNEYRSFVKAYGFDVMEWPGYSTLRDTLELTMLTWIAGRAETDPAAVPEARQRIHDVRTGSSRRSWKPF
ncbi:phosphotransferase enzyme family protein [Microlunatus sp. GCM10028923]|uniref:phosphotransferase enzyme family protein n=1 Tax=Microlunatus sp. GCM10028923 TaxID=3273400 RepID=UPI003618A9C2